MPGQDTANLSFEMMLKVQIHHPAWYFFYLLSLLGMFAWIRIYYSSILIQTAQASTSFQVANRMFKDNSLLQNQLDTVLYLFYFLSMAFLLYYIELRIARTPYGWQGGLLYLFNLAVLAGIFFCRWLVMNAAGFLFNRSKIFKEYLYNIFIFNKIAGVAILPLMFLLVYTRGWLQVVFFWLALGIVAGVVVMRLIRGVVFSYRKDILIFYMFLYLCALEIVPLVLLYRWLEGIL